MPTYRRNYAPGGTYFFTVVTHGREPFLTTPLARKCLHGAFAEEGVIRPFDIVAILLLPDHLHTIWTLPDGDDDYSTRWKRIKGGFTDAYLAAGGWEGERSASRRKRGERAVWQRRFWEHTVRDENDHERCMNYVHWNPVKHGLVTRVADYEWSSFHRWVRSGEYDAHWGEGEVPQDIPGAEWE